MDPIKKTKSKRGMSLVEVLVVVMLMTIMLGIAMPNILAESQSIKLATMDGYARSVAVAVQSKLYGMKDAGTAMGSSYANLNAAAETEHIGVADGEKPVNYVCNFGKNAAVGKHYLLSGAITDTEMLENGKIVVVYDPVTADVLEVFYGEEEFSVEDIFPTVNESFLENNNIGLYRGEGAPAPEYNLSLPRFAAEWKDDDEKYLELIMRTDPDPQLLDKHLGLEVYALLPTGDPLDPWDQLLIYTEGLLASDYKTTLVTAPDYQTIKSEATEPLTLDKIYNNDKKLRFAIDSMVVQRSAYSDAKGNIQQNLHRQYAPGKVSVTEPVLYPRETVSNWLDGSYNPYISFGVSEEVYEISEDLRRKVSATTPVADYVDFDEALKLKVKLYVLGQDESGNYTTEQTKGDAGSLRYVADENLEPVVITSDNTSPYFYSYSSTENEVALASMRDLQNLHYVFEAKDCDINRARLYHDITSQQLYEKLVSVRYAYRDKLIDVSPDDFNNFNNADYWPRYANSENLALSSLFSVDYSNRGGFTITGKKSSGGRYSIEDITMSGNDMSLGGWIRYANNITVEDLDIVNPHIWKHAVNRDFFVTDEKGELKGFKVNWNSGISGGLFAIADHCTFKNVHCYVDASRTLRIETGADIGKDTGERGNTPVVQYFVSNIVAGGLVGIAVGTNDKATTFTNCSASVTIGLTFESNVSYVDYAGGLVGVAMGNVSIINSYGACQLSGRYSGGLVGAVVNGSFSSNVDGNGMLEANYPEVSGTLTIDNSFSAGRIQRQTQVGGGLIAQIAKSAKDKVEAENCYSATVWDVLPPVSYATFEGDKSCYYLAQKEITLPITMNTGTRFSITGDVFALQNKDNKIGNAVKTPEQLQQMIGSGGWTASENTLIWRWANDDYATSGIDTSGSHLGAASEAYPYPMPEGNTFFRGDWLEGGANTAIAAGGKTEAAFEGYYCAVYDLSYDFYITPVDPGRLKEEEFDFSGVAPQLNGKNLDASGQWWLDTWDVNTQAAFPYLEDAVGLTNVTFVNGDEVTFSGTPYYRSDYDPKKGYNFYPKTSDNTEYCINFDYYSGYYATRTADGSYQYYLMLDDTVPTGSAVLENDRLKVNKEELEQAIGYTSFTFKISGATLSWANGHFTAD